MRRLGLNVGVVNIITGSSKTGKSALADVVDYCLGAGECRVPEGPIRRAVSWYGLRIKLDKGEAFIARRCPSTGKASSEDCFVEVGTEVSVPAHSLLHQTTNTKGLEALLTSWVGIKDNLNEPAPGQTRLPLSANIRHALPYCYQPQDEIIRRQQLFHGASDGFFAQALKDTLPYFLGAVDDDFVSKRDALRRLRDQLRARMRQLAELESLRGDGASKAAGLLAEAREMGLTEVEATEWEGIVDALRQVTKTPLAGVEYPTPKGEEYVRLSDVRSRLLNDQRTIREEISTARAFELSGVGYSREAREQKARLYSIGIFEGEPGHACPLCTQPLDVSSLMSSTAATARLLTDVSSRLESVTRAAPRIERAISELEARHQNVQELLNGNRGEMEAILSANERVREVQDELARRALVVGRVSLYVESLPDLPDTKALEESLQLLRDQIGKLEEELSDSTVKERLDSIAAILAKKMTDWAGELDLEHSKSPLRLDLRRLTIVADTPNGPVPMERMGSGENWVGYHLIAHLALHTWFAEHSRPVPRFLFLDQPSQVYFPPEKDIDGSITAIDEEDRLAVVRMFQFVFGAVAAIAPELQVIVTEHADLKETWYQQAVVERWRGGTKLVPEDWPPA